VSSRGVDDGADCNERPSHRRLPGILFSVLSAIVIALIAFSFPPPLGSSGAAFRV